MDLRQIQSRQRYCRKAWVIGRYCPELCRKERSEFIKEIESKYSQREINESEYLHECSELADNYVKIFEGDNGPGKPPKIGYNDALTLRRVILGEIFLVFVYYIG